MLMVRACLDDLTRSGEVAYMIAVLTAAGASFVNGAVIVVDGGMTAWGH
jgi:NAD(P)-dependent dehydrogenase (short-subunit alcohol dehydrogenase family)